MLRKDSNKDWNSQISNIKNIIYKMEIKIKNLYFHRWHYKMKVDKGVEVRISLIQNILNSYLKPLYFNKDLEGSQ